MRRSIVVLVVGLAIAFGGTPGGVARAGDDLSAITNQDRQAQGRRPLTSVPELQSFAQRRAEEMARTRRLWHTENLGDNISNWRRLGENVGKGPSVADIERSFMASRDHRENILFPEFSEFGAGVASDGGHTVYVTVIFRQPAGPAPAAGPPPAPRASAAATRPPRPARPATTTTTAPAATTTTAAAPAAEPPPVDPPLEPVPVEQPAAPAPAAEPEPAPALVRPPVNEQLWFLAANSWDPGVPDAGGRPRPMQPVVAAAVVGLIGLCGGVHHMLRRRLLPSPGPNRRP